MGMQKLAEHVIRVTHDAGRNITNLQLHKIMYFIIGRYTVNNGITDFINALYDEPFEAWPYGPVIRTEYFKNNKFGSMDIRRQAELFADYAIFNDDILHFVDRNIFELVEETHTHPRWADNRNDIVHGVKTITYSLEDIQNAFQSV